MKLKLDAEGRAVLQDGKPVYVHDDGKEAPFDAPGTVATISRLNAEAKGHREAKEAAEAKLKGFEGIEDPAAARKALDTVKNLDAKRLVDAGEVDKIKAEAIKAVEDKYAPVVKERDTLQSALVTEKVGGSFARSKFIAEKVAVPTELLQSTFGKNFKVEGNDVVAYDDKGNKVFSRSNPGEIAKFDEALEIIIGSTPFRDQILKGTGASGSGAAGGQGGNTTGKFVSRVEFDKMPPAAQHAHVMGGGTVQD